jgi:hypothetical protein
MSLTRLHKKNQSAIGLDNILTNISTYVNLHKLQIA